MPVLPMLTLTVSGSTLAGELVGDQAGRIIITCYLAWGTGVGLCGAFVQMCAHSYADANLSLLLPGMQQLSVVTAAPLG